ncbi:MAG: hypothetical protein FJX37_02775 [Alphaproteobacteria bacterium]|nr:hypothetical protein [Alphaproteobacteria bacterium]MBM3951840.1 hypothetical protein [Rhodospirillales bacterium]
MSDTRYFSEREVGETPRNVDEVTATAWSGIAALIRTCIDDGSFGARYPEICPDGADPCGTNQRSFWEAMRAEIPKLPDMPSTILNDDVLPSSLVIMDMIEFCWRAVGRPIRGVYHGYSRHHHLSFDEDAGKREFGDVINRIFRRNGLAFELTDGGMVRRLAPAVLREALGQTVFHTEDLGLNQILETARTKFFDPDESVRREALEKLWDAWERIKSLEPGANKAVQSAALLDRTANSSAPKFRELLEEEAKTLTNIGNTFHIRHTETHQERLGGSNEIDYLFHRLFAFIRLILRTTGRGG